jgi:hypothetical protein
VQAGQLQTNLISLTSQEVGSPLNHKPVDSRFVGLGDQLSRPVRDKEGRHSLEFTRKRG